MVWIDDGVYANAELEFNVTVIVFFKSLFIEETVKLSSRFDF